MFKFSKFEALGIFISIGMMAMALFLLNVESAQLSLQPAAVNQLASVVVVEDGEDQDQKALAEALKDSFAGTRTQQLVVVDDVKIGGGDEAVSGKTVSVHYVGRLENGQEFDNSKKRGEPFVFTLGEGEVIEGWEQGIVGMKVGGERTLVVPPQFAYGKEGFGPIPPNATLLFTVELLSVE